MRTFGMLVLIGVLGLPLVATAEEAAQQPSQERVRSMPRTWAGLGLVAGGAIVVLTGNECRVSGSFREYSTLFINLNGGNPVLSESCALQDFTISGTIFFDSFSRKASDYNVNALQRQIKSHIEADVQGDKVRKPLHLYGGLAMMGAGVLLATIWADVAAVRNLTVAPTRGGVHVSASFGF